jgi:3-dehydroquinate synthase
MRTVHVALGSRSYPILVGDGLLASLGKRCQPLGLAPRCAVIADANVAPRFAHIALASLSDAGFHPVLVTVPAGEPAKRLRVVEHCFNQLAAHRLERRSFVVALGGGVTGDLAGFVAAAYLRGIAFVQVPTTLLAQVDSSVGGKVGVNLAAGKNLVGAFHQPRLVLCDLDVLRTLPDREFRAGLAEVIKYGILADATLFRRLERDLDRLLDRDPAVLAPVVARCCEIKAGIVAEDETETGRRATLNYGHTLGHAIEAITAYGRYLHGEAISVGQVAASLLSARLTGLPLPEVARIRTLFERAGLPTSIRLSPAQRERLFAAMRLDKKVAGGEVKFVLARRIGDVVWGRSVPDAEIHAVLDAIRPPRRP